MPLKLSAKDRDYAQKLDLLLKQERAGTQDVADVVSDIIDDELSDISILDQSLSNPTNFGYNLFSLDPNFLVL